MDFREKLKSQRNKVVYSITDKCILIGGYQGSGKEQPISEPVLSENGWTTMGDIEIGDRVFGKDGKLHNVIGVYPQGIKKVYRVSFSDGTSTRCGAEHLWKVYTSKQRFKNKKRENEVFFIKKLSEIMKDYSIANGNDKSLRHKYSIPVANPIDFKNNIDLELDPYFLGLMIGDGGLTNAITFTNSEIDILNYVYDYMKQNDKNYYSKDFENHKQISLYSIKDHFKKLNLYGCGSREKFIPKEYLYSNIENRRLLLSGIINTDGSVSKEVSISITTYSYNLYNDIKELSRGLGYIAIGREKDRTDENSTKKYEKEIEYTIHLIGDFKDLKLSQKHLSKLKPRKNGEYSKLITNIELIGEEESKCIMIDSEDHLYITNEYIVTHNTPIMHELSNILTEEYNDEFITLMFPLEKRYTNYDIRKYIPPELNYYDKNKVLLIEKCSEGNLSASKISFIRILNMLDEEIKESVMNVIGCDIETFFNKKILDINLTIDKINKLAIQTRKMILDKEPTNYTSFLHLVDGVAEIKKQKMLDKDYSLKIAIFDPLTIVEDYAKEYLLWEVFDRTKKTQTENEYGGARRGAIYFDATKLIFDNIIKPLNSVGIETWFTFHTKLKGFKDKITDIEYDTYTSRNTSNIFGKVLDMADYSMIFEDTMFISNGMSGSKEDRILRWRNGGNYTGCKATAELEKIPSVQNVKGLSDKEIARLIYDTIVNSLKPKDISDSQFKIETKNQELEMKNKMTLKNDTMLQIDGIGDNVEKEKNTKVLFVSNLETLLKTVNDSSRVQLENYLKTVTGEKSISDWVSDVNKDTFNKVADTINNAISGIDGIEKLPRLE